MVYNVVVVKLAAFSTFCTTGFKKGRLGFCDKGDGGTPEKNVGFLAHVFL